MQSLAICFCDIHFSIILRSTPMSPMCRLWMRLFDPIITCILFSQTCYMFRRSLHPSFKLTVNTLRNGGTRQRSYAPTYTRCGSTATGRSNYDVQLILVPGYGRDTALEGQCPEIYRTDVICDTSVNAGSSCIWMEIKHSVVDEKGMREPARRESPSRMWIWLLE